MTRWNVEESSDGDGSDSEASSMAAEPSPMPAPKKEKKAKNAKASKKEKKAKKPKKEKRRAEPEAEPKRAKHARGEPPPAAVGCITCLDFPCSCAATAAAAAAAQAGHLAAQGEGSFGLNEDVTGAAVRGAASTQVDDAAQGTPLEDFDLLPETSAILRKRGIELLFPIQSATYHRVLEGKDLIGRAKTGQGKTLAFVLPIVFRLLGSGKARPALEHGRYPRVLGLAPTRELAKQVLTEFEVMAPTLKCACIYGGAQYWPQESALSAGLDVVVGTPGRVIDHIDRGNLKLSSLEYLVLDEADEMLDIGFEEDIEKVLAAASEQHADVSSVQKLLWSATIPQWVASVAKKYMTDHIIVDIVAHERQQTSSDVTHMAIACQVHTE